MCYEHTFKYFAEHLPICSKCGLEDRKPYILSESNYTFQTLRYPPYSRIMRFGPLTDDLEPEVRCSVLCLYQKILTRWRRFATKRSRYFYNRKLMFRWLHCKVTNSPFTNVLQNLESQAAQIAEMEYLLENEPPQRKFQLYRTPIEKLWDMFDELR